MRAIILILWDTWARPSEILSRQYQTDIDDTDERGIMLLVPTSKVNPGPEPEILTITHNKSQEFCSVCALRAWCDYLGSDWSGPLFPGIIGLEPTRIKMRSTQFWGRFTRLVTRTWGEHRHYSPYSIRRGGATTAAALGWPMSEIKLKLRHDDEFQSMAYIDPAEMFALMGRLS